jgi:osmotically-inducible protein OsmY
MSNRTTRAFLQLLALLVSLTVPMLGCGREEEQEIDTPSGEVEVETEREAGGGTEAETETGNESNDADLGDDLEDAGITAKVKTRLASDERVSAFDVDVDAREGVVTLKGSVSKEEAKAAAEEIARATDGVSDVVNMITVGSGDSSAT